jgi:hypothetical protein
MTTSLRAMRRTWRARLFRVGDGVFLITVGAESGIVMYCVSELPWNPVLLSLLGMAAAMILQMTLAFGLSPLLGSIETMAPSMVVAMVVPMLVDLYKMVMDATRLSDAAITGAIFGALFFGYLQWYEVVVGRRLARAWPTRAERP